MKKTTKNPYGLTGKQLLVIDDMVAKVKAGGSVTPVDSTEKVYNVSSRESAKTISSRNMNNPDFRRAFLDAFYEKRILGENSLVEEKLTEGLSAIDKDGNVDFGNRLKYIQEVNKIAGVYAPEKKESRHLNLNIDLTEEELDNRIRDLQEELEE